MVEFKWFTLEVLKTTESEIIHIKDIFDHVKARIIDR